MALRRRSWLGVAIAASTCGYVGYHGLQEDTSMASWSPLAWILVDGRLWHLEPPPQCVVVGYYATTGDGPKLPGSDVTLRCAMDRGEAEAWARRWLREQGFREEVRPSTTSMVRAPSPTMVTASQIGEYWVGGGRDGDVTVRVALLQRPR